MKQNLRRGIALLLCLALCFSLTINVFASNELGISYTAILSQSTVDASDKDQTVNLTIGTSAPVTLDSIEVIVSDASGKLVVGTPSGYPNGGTASYNDKANKLSWMNLGDDNIEDVTTLAVFPITIPANTPADEYVINVTGIKLSKDWGTTWEDGGSATTTLTVKDNTPAAEGYTVAVSGNTTIQTGDKAMVKLDITNPKVDHYNAVDMKLTYDANVLSFDKDSCINLPTEATVTDTNGSLRIQFYGADRTAEIQLAFTGKAGGTSEVKVTEAKVDEAANANMQNAPAATVTGSATITVGQTYTVNRDTSVVDGNPKAEAGKDYTFKLANGLDGTYMDVSYTVDGVNKGTLTPDSNGIYTVPGTNVTGDITITAVGKTYTVTKDGTGATDVTLNGNTATYGTDYTFTLNKADNYAYTVEVTAGDKTVTSTLDADGKTYTINGKDITGNVVITVTKEANKAQINFAGSGVADVVNGSTSQTVEPGQDFKFSIDKKDGYEYIVTAEKKDGTAVTVKDNGDGTYTIAGTDIKAGDVITVTVEKKLIETKYTVEVNEFVKIGANAEGKAQSVFLITAKLNDVTLADGKVLVYGNNAMFQNAERYDGAYAYLVISDKTLDEVKAEAEKAGQITEVTGTAQTFNVNGDVNGTGLVDINDAQLVYNIYNTKYDSFDNTTMAMFLAADVNNSKTVDVKDAAAVVAKIQ